MQAPISFDIDVNPLIELQEIATEAHPILLVPIENINPVGATGS
jgi:hypothetical protein